MKFLNLKPCLLFLLMMISSIMYAHDDCDCEEHKDHSMSLRGSDPFKSMHQSFHKRIEQMDRMFNSMAFGSFDGEPAYGFFNTPKPIGVQTKKYDHDDHKIIEILLGGGDSSDINVEVKGDMITISVNETHKNKSESDSGYFSESSYQSVSKKIIPVPDGVISEQVKIENKDGKLILRFPKRRV